MANTRKCSSQSSHKGAIGKKNITRGNEYGVGTIQERATIATEHVMRQEKKIHSMDFPCQGVELNVL